MARPKKITRKYVVDLLLERCLFDGTSRKIANVIFDALVDIEFLHVSDDHVEVAGHPGSTGEYPPSAAEAIRRTLESFVAERSCGYVLKWILRGADITTKFVMPPLAGAETIMRPMYDEAIQYLDWNADAFSRSLPDPGKGAELVSYLRDCFVKRRDKSPYCWHNEDFTEVIWFGIPYSFALLQARCVKLLWMKAESSTDIEASALHQKDILAAAHSDSEKLGDLFKTHAAWKSMIVGQKNGLYRLSRRPGPPPPV